MKDTGKAESAAKQKEAKSKGGAKPKVAIKPKIATKPKVERLSWKGYSDSKKVSLAGWTHGFSFPDSIMEKIPYCAESLDLLSGINTKKRQAMQGEFFERTDHSVMSTIYLGLMREQESKKLKEQITLCLKTICRLMQVTASEGLDSAALSKIFDALPEASSRSLKSALSSSCHFYANGKVRDPFKNALNQPFYVETGIDILGNGLDFMLAEFQVRYATPYPHLLRDMCRAYHAIHPQMFKKFSLKPESFMKRRDKIFQECVEAFAQQDSGEIAKIVIDAWAYNNNKGANLKGTAKDLGMDYLVFDDMLAGQTNYERVYGKKRLAVFNQVALNLIDPSDEFFQFVNSERLENYDELAWVGFLERYLKGEVFMANSPFGDLINDKALYTALPDLCKVFFNQELELKVVTAKNCWAEGDFKKPDPAVLKWASENKDKAVITHRYLEGGLGIRVGPATSQEEWDSFIETFVADRPYMYVVRDYFKMNPDFALRALACLALPTLQAPMELAKVEISDSFFARVSAKSPLSTDNHRSFLIYTVPEGATQPRYEIDNESAR